MARTFLSAEPMFMCCYVNEFTEYTAVVAMLALSSDIPTHFLIRFPTLGVNPETSRCLQTIHIHGQSISHKNNCSVRESNLRCVAQSITCQTCRLFSSMCGEKQKFLYCTETTALIFLTTQSAEYIEKHLLE